MFVVHTDYYEQTDIFVIGLEEMVDLTASTVVSESQSQRRSQIWIDTILSTLHRNYSRAVFMIQCDDVQEDTYYCVASKILVGVFLCIFARVSLKPSIRNVMSLIHFSLLFSCFGCYRTSWYDGQQRWCWNPYGNQ